MIIEATASGGETALGIYNGYAFFRDDNFDYRPYGETDIDEDTWTRGGNLKDTVQEGIPYNGGLFTIAQNHQVVEFNAENYIFKMIHPDSPNTPYEPTYEKDAYDIKKIQMRWHVSTVYDSIKTQRDTGEVTTNHSSTEDVTLRVIHMRIANNVVEVEFNTCQDIGPVTITGGLLTKRLTVSRIRS